MVSYLSMDLSRIRPRGGVLPSYVSAPFSTSTMLLSLLGILASSGGCLEERSRIRYQPTSMRSAPAFVCATGALSLPAQCGRPLALIRHASKASGEEEEAVWPGLARYSWAMPSHVKDSNVDASQLADHMLEIGAASASLVPEKPIDVTADKDFARSGKISLKSDRSGGCNNIEFWIFEYSGEVPTDTDKQAESLVREVLGSLCPDENISDQGSLNRIIDTDDDIVPDDDLSSDAIHVSDGTQTLRINGVNLSILSSLDSKWAFGDGLHPSTSLSIRGLEDFAGEYWASEQPFSLLDYGCGSGILTLVGLALGADIAASASVDISDDALFLTKENLRRNKHIINQSETVQVLKSLDDGRGNWEGSFDIVVANIPSNTLAVLLPTLTRALKDGAGVVLCSGYPTTEVEKVTKTANDCGLDEEIARRRYESGWVLQVFGAGRSTS